MKTNNKIQKAHARKEAIKAGAMDGRYRTRLIPNKKKQEQKKRIKVIY